MQSTSILTIIKMIEALPETAQKQVVEHLRDYIADLRDAAEWDELIEKTQPKLVQAAQLARRQIAEGHSSPLDESQL